MQLTYNDSFYIQIIDFNGKSNYKNVSGSDTISYLFQNLSTVVVHYVGYKKISANSFLIIVSDKETKVNIVTVFIILGICIISVLILVIILYRCRQAYLLKQQQEEERLEMQARQMDGGVNVYPSNAENERDRVEANVNKLELLFLTKLKPKRYTYAINEFQSNCTICLEEFNLESMVIKLDSCKHIFHSSCLNNSLMKNALNPKCPNCNLSIFDERNPDESHAQPINNVYAGPPNNSNSFIPVSKSSGEL